MKLYHFVLVFIIIAITTILTLDIKTNNLKALYQNKEQIDHNLDTAIDDGVTSLAEVDGMNNITVSKDAAVNSLFLSLYASFGILSNKEKQEKLNLYIPVVTITTEDGYYVFYSDEYQGLDGYTYASKRWSEKFPYYYEDEDFIYGFTLGDTVTVYDKNELFDVTKEQKVFCLDYHEFQTKEEYASFRTKRPSSILLNDASFELIRKDIIITCIENSMAYYTSNHNKIAAAYGITYNFSLPVIQDGEWAAYIDDISMLVVFQGYPYGEEVGEAYNRVASAGAKVTKRKVYYLEQKRWYLIYHKSTCTELLNDNIIFHEEPYYDAITCIEQGAYACPICNKTGVYAPDYAP